MRLSSLLFAVLVIGVVLGIARDEVGRLALIVFLTGLGTTVAGVASIMALFQTIGAFGEARTISAHVEALAATIVVLAVGSSVMLGLMFGGGLYARADVGHDPVPDCRRRRIGARLTRAPSRGRRSDRGSSGTCRRPGGGIGASWSSAVEHASTGILPALMARRLHAGPGSPVRVPRRALRLRRSRPADPAFPGHQHDPSRHFRCDFHPRGPVPNGDDPILGRLDSAWSKSRLIVGRGKELRRD